MSTKSKVLIRRAQPIDGIAIHWLLHECGEALARQGFLNWRPPADLERVMSDITAEEVYVASVDKDLSGAVADPILRAGRIQHDVRARARRLAFRADDQGVTVR